jgi:hypothetical protein
VKNTGSGVEPSQMSEGNRGFSDIFQSFCSIHAFTIWTRQLL